MEARAPISPSPSPMSGKGRDPVTPMVSKPPSNSNPNRDEAVSQHSNSPQLLLNDSHSPSPKKPQTLKEFLLSVASKIAAQPFQNHIPGVWGVLTALSKKARKRAQGINVLLTDDEHWIGRSVNARFRLDSNSVSGNHCMIYRKQVDVEDVVSPSNVNKSVFLKDTSTNGTYINWEKLSKNNFDAKIQNGDIVSFSAPPDHELAYAFVYRDLISNGSTSKAAGLKRKADDYGSENKRLKGIGIGAPEGPISLDDFRSLQRSNTELRKQLENQVLMIDTLQNESRVVAERHDNETKELKALLAQSYSNQITELQHLLDIKTNELVEASKMLAEQKHAMHDLQERLSASLQSCTEANEIINSQKASISELKAQLHEERDQRKEEREKAVSDLKAAVQKVQSEAQDEMKRVSDDALRREREQQELIDKLQELEKERSLLVETLRSKLENIRKKLVISDNKVHQLETQVCEQQQTSAAERKRIEDLEHEVKRLKKELDSEKAAREEAWAKVSALELEMNAALRDLDFERRRLRGARERIMLRETQLRAFYSTTEEISVLFAKQQKQLKAMQKTLEDQENYENTSLDIYLNQKSGNISEVEVREREEAARQISGTAQEGSATSGRNFVRNQVDTSSDEVSATEKHDCDMRSREEAQDTQEVEFTGINQDLKGGFGSNVDGAVTCPVLDGDAVGTEQVLETESQGVNSEHNFDLNKSTVNGEDTMQLDVESHVQETEERDQITCERGANQSQSNIPVEVLNDTEPGDTMKTADLLTSEVAGSWACSSAPSARGENGTPGSRNIDFEAAGTLHSFSAQAAESQSTPCSEAVVASRMNHERQALSTMIGIVAPDLKDQFEIAADNGCEPWRGEKVSTSGSDTEDCTGSRDGAGANVDDVSSDAETVCGQGDETEKPDDDDDDATDGDDGEAMQDDSMG